MCTCCFSIYITPLYTPLYVIKGDGSQFVKARPHVKQTFQYFLGAKRENVATEINSILKLLKFLAPTKKKVTQTVTSNDFYTKMKREPSLDSGNRALFRIPSNRRGTLVSVLYENCDHYSL